MPVILSTSDPDDPRPWFRFTFDGATLTVDMTEANGLAAYSKANGRAVSKQKEAAARRKHAFTLAPERRADLPPRDPALPPRDQEVHVLAMTEDGDLEFVPQSEQRPVYYAHLAWYDPATGDVAVLEFVDPEVSETP